MFIASSAQQLFHVNESHEVASVRRAASELARQLGFDEVKTGQLALIVTEAATNIVKHAAEGRMLLRALHCENDVGVEVLALDNGPGMSDLSAQLVDGHSSVGSYGVGLGAIARLSQEFDIFTQPDRGCVLYMAIWANGNGPSERTWRIGAVCLPLAGELACGDAWAVNIDDSALTLLVADGLGHGPEAATASQAAVLCLEESVGKTPSELAQLAHGALRKTRGAALAFADITPLEQRVRFCGVGNIAVSVFDGPSRQHLISHNGIVGANIRKLQEFTYLWQDTSLLIAHSDGINTRWDLERYEGLLECHPSVIAGVLYRDFSRNRDDVTVVVIRESPWDTH